MRDSLFKTIMKRRIIIKKQPSGSALLRSGNSKIQSVLAFPDRCFLSQYLSEFTAH